MVSARSVSTGFLDLFLRVSYVMVMCFWSRKERGAYITGGVNVRGNTVYLIIV